MAETLKSRFLNEITSRQAAEVIRRTSAVILPVGTVELHGPHLPMGCDGFISKAFAVKLADRIDALIAPMEHYSYIGATSKFPGGVSVPFSASMEFLRHVVSGLLATGFKHILMISFHWPNAVALDAVAREMFERTGVPVVNLRPQSIITAEIARSVTDDESSADDESLLCAGALQILGLLDLVDPASWPDEKYVPVEPESLRRVQKIGNVGYYFTDELSHVPPSAGIDPGKGAAIIERAADKLAGLLDDLGGYADYLRDRYGKI
mgnify:CR=1 FL=1